MLNMTHEFGFVAGAITRWWQFDDWTIAVVVVVVAANRNLWFESAAAARKLLVFLL